jgi:hypothetical protein
MKSSLSKTGLLVALLWVFSGNVAAQSIMAFAPWQLGAEAWTAPKEDLAEFAVSVRRAVPLETLLPQITDDSFLYALHLQVGSRFLGGDYDRIRYRGTALNVAMQRAYTSGSFTVLDHNQADIRDRYTTWLGASFGPGVHLDGPGHDMWIRVTAGGRWATLTDGELLFPGNTRADKPHSGLSYQLETRAGLSLGHRLQLGASFQWDEMPGADRLTKTWNVDASFRASKRFVMSAGYHSTRFETEEWGRDMDGINARLWFTPSAGAF